MKHFFIYIYTWFLALKKKPGWANKQPLLLFFLIISSFSIAQIDDSYLFEARYNTTLKLLSNTRDTVESLIISMQNSGGLSEVQQAKINFIKTKIQNLHETDPVRGEIFDPVIDSNEKLPLFVRATELIVRSRPNKGIPLLLKFIETLEEHSDSSVYAKIYLAEGYRKIGEYKKGIDIISELLKYDNISLTNKAFAYHRMAAIYAQSGTIIVDNKSDSVFKYSNRCIEISEADHFTEFLATSQNELAFYYRRKGEYQLALDFGLKAYDNFISVKKIPQAMNTSINLANIYSRMGNLQEASKVLTSALELADVNTYRTLFMRIYLSLAEVTKELGDINSAYDYLSIARKMQIDLNNIRIKAQIYEMSAKYEAEKKEHENMLLKKDVELEKRKSSYLMILTIVLILAGIVSIALFYFIRKTAVNKKKLAESEAGRLEEKVAHQKRELASSTLTLSRNLEFMNSLIEDIHGLSENVDNEKAFVSIRRIIKKLERQNSDKYWQEFEARFQEIHRNFYQILHANFPGLTTNDVKLCALLKMGMNTKEICSVTFQGVRAVEAARLRLRKKLRLASNENLGVFLQKI